MIHRRNQLINEHQQFTFCYDKKKTNTKNRKPVGMPEEDGRTADQKLFRGYCTWSHVHVIKNDKFTMRQDNRDKIDE